MPVLTIQSGHLYSLHFIPLGTMVVHRISEGTIGNQNFCVFQSRIDAMGLTPELDGRWVRI
jgi:hypothetical protein